jgi:dihydroorotate dehydrogenase electron transfer subunit
MLEYNPVQMRQTDALITGLDASGPFARVTLAAPDVASGLAAGRFVLAELGDTLRSPLFPARLGGDDFDTLVPPEHEVAQLQPGATINVIGPLGQGFEVQSSVRRLLLVADTVHLPPLLSLAQLEHQVSSREPDLSIALLLCAPNASELYPVRLLPPALEVHIVTADGSVGHKGSPLDLFPDLARWADCVCIAAKPDTYPVLAQTVREVRLGPGPGFAQALLVPPLVCGVGACQGCAVETARGAKLACTDGPVFELLTLGERP